MGDKAAVKFKLKIGEKYTSRDGTEVSQIVRLSQKHESNYRKTHPFVDQDGYTYMADGRSHPTKEYPFDLVAIHKPLPKKKNKKDVKSRG